MQKRLEKIAGQQDIIPNAYGVATIHDTSVATRLTLMGSIIGPLVKSRNEPGGMDINDIDRVHGIRSCIRSPWGPGKCDTIIDTSNITPGRTMSST